MKIITQYQCEVCNKRHNTEQSAAACEARGTFDPSIYPKGLMYEYSHNGYVGIFTHAEVACYPNDPHLGYAYNWACRDRTTNHNGDSVGEEKCGGNFMYTDVKAWSDRLFITKEKVNGPEFNRMVSFLKSEGITPSYYNEDRELIFVN